MSLIRLVRTSCLIAGLTLVASLSTTWVATPTVEAQVLSQDEGFIPCTEDNVGQTVVVIGLNCRPNTLSWRVFTCTERNGSYFWHKGAWECGDIIMPGLD